MKEILIAGILIAVVFGLAMSDFETLIDYESTVGRSVVDASRQRIYSN